MGLCIPVTFTHTSLSIESFAHICTEVFTALHLLRFLWYSPRCCCFHIHYSCSSAAGVKSVAATASMQILQTQHSLPSLLRCPCRRTLYTGSLTCWCLKMSLPPQSWHLLLSLSRVPQMLLFGLFLRWAVFTLGPEPLLPQILLPPQYLHLLHRHWCTQALRRFVAAARRSNGTTVWPAGLDSLSTS